ncbi:LLM class flavin-dependent oxidoreductase [Kribbella solani]|uniref:Alkanesulfonate monooxygenase SsuD/methylene tetrahydromethanopterin reductase-like flavin-dependent oxidoreductase (Luciferase family) n=1 Tax=Kribbella solani TaxID=236067 RepID=A0A841DRN3_9ACTN|nr:LLM class flavin-dependent oxidoreductase [Kribbella solani]MBB5978987.1 alkanesulfonate monooxygenase SsuD/methylene tetrahydromethanopterin reductase-like flavin-dependent oxidoreductase (luciferase family) [Kribbella solani]
MKYGFVMAYGDARDAAELAVLAEAHGWDGFFVWESIWGIDAWVMLGAAAMTTERIRLGTMLTPLPRRKPWDVAGQVSTVDNLSNGRVILSVGLGVTGEQRFWLFEDDPGRKVRAELMDESLAMLPHLWRDEPFEFTGKHFRASVPAELTPPAPPPAVQQPRVPTWVVGGWPAPKSMRRAALQDGWLPNVVGGAELTPELLAQGVEWIATERRTHGLTMDDYDVVAEGTTRADDPKAADTVRAWADAGATWWMDADWSSLDRDATRPAAERRLKAGPPRID